ncbi:MAG: hypothetical protein OEY49_14830 [Candidatus Heimdallarchaeota archaeon]|nr:hypothetical protein [Candidatus Heimdallarchaeota archaeon]
MVDASNQSNTASIIDKKVNPFLQTSNISGRIIEDEESIALKIQQENEGSYGYWLGVFFFVFILFLIGIYGLNK